MEFFGAVTTDPVPRFDFTQAGGLGTAAVRLEDRLGPGYARALESGAALTPAETIEFARVTLERLAQG